MVYRRLKDRAQLCLCNIPNSQTFWDQGLYVIVQNFLSLLIHNTFIKTAQDLIVCPINLLNVALRFEQNDELC